MADGKIELTLGTEGDVAYVTLPDHPGRGVVAGVAVKQVRLLDLMSDYQGPDLYFDFDKENRLTGIEILA